MPACRSCDAPIVFVRTKARKLMPVDANLRVENAIDRDSSATFEELRSKLGDDVVVSHFSTCPDADQHRHERR